MQEINAMVEEMCGMVLKEYPTETEIDITPGFHQAEARSIKIMVKKEIMKGFKSAVKNTAERTFHLMMKRGQLDHIPYIAQMRSAIMPHVSEWMFITINAKPGILFGSLKNKVENYVTQANIDVAMYNFEQRGETVDDIRGFHSHILVKQTHKFPSQFIGQLSKAFQKVTDINNKHAFNYKWSDPKFLKNRINYIKGIKADKDKNPKIKIDHVWRARTKQKPWYETSFFETRADYAVMDIEQSDDWVEDYEPPTNPVSGDVLGQARGPYQGVLQEEEDALP